MMKRIPLRSALLAAMSLFLSGCHRAADPAAELEKAAAAMATAEPEPASADTAGNPPSTDPPPAQEVRQALSDYKEGKMEDAVTRLQLLRNVRVMSPQQRMALQDSIAAVMAEVYTLAEKGDQRAIAAVAQYERMQNRR